MQINAVLPQDLSTAASPTFAGITLDNLSGILKGTAGVVSAITDNSANWNLAYAHISESGASHTFIDQNVTTAGTPTFAKVTVDSLQLDGNTLSNTGTLHITSTHGLIISATDYIQITDAAPFYTNGYISCDELTITHPTTDYKFSGRGGFIALTPTSVVDTAFELYSGDVTADGGGGNYNCYFQIYALGSPANITNYENILFGFSQPNQRYQLRAASAGTGVQHPIHIWATESDTDQLYIDHVNGRIGIQQDTPLYDLDINGTVRAVTPAADTEALIIDGDTNPYDYASSVALTFGNQKRTVTGSGNTPINGGGIYGWLRSLTWDYDYTGSNSNFATKTIAAGGDTLTFSGNLTFNAGLGAKSGTRITANLSQVQFSGAYTSNKSVNSLWIGGYFSAINSGTYNITANTTLLEFMGGKFTTAGSAPTDLAGGVTPDFNYYGGYFEGIGTAVGDSVVYGGYFTATGGDTNYGVYSAAGLNYFAEDINTAGVLKVSNVQVVGAQQAHIADADGTLADITTKFNTLLSYLDADAGHGLLAGA